MHKTKVLHLFNWDKKFFYSFKELLDESINSVEHKYIVYGNISGSDVKKAHNVFFCKNILDNFLFILSSVRQADKIILHGLFNTHLIYLLSTQPWHLKKCYWVIWGGDLYAHNRQLKDWRWHKNELFRRFVIRRLGHLVTYISGDVSLVRQWYGSKGQYHECLMYPSNLYKEYNVPQKEHATVNIQVGNSADPSNNHLEVFEKLIPYKDQDIKIFVPLSYGDQIYAKNIVEVGRRMFGNKFVPLTSFMPFEEYLKFMGQIDIAVFNHRRQQAMGNTITLLGLGKSVYIRSDTTQWKLFKKIDITIYDISKLNDKNKLLTKTLPDNIEKIKKYFHIQNLERQWSAIFNG